MPWSSVIKSSAGNAEFWDKELKEPALLYTVGHGKVAPTPVDRLMEQNAEAATQGGAAGSGSRSAKRRRRQQDQRPQPAQQARGPAQTQKKQKGTKGDGKGGHPRKGKDGK